MDVVELPIEQKDIEWAESIRPEILRMDMCAEMEERGMVKLVLLRDIWTEEGRQRAGKVITIRNTDEALDLVERGIARRLRDEDEVKRMGADGEAEVIKKAGEPVKRKRGRRKKGNGADT